MQFTLLSLVSLLALAAAQDTIPNEIAKLPQHTVSCLDNTIQKSGCNPNDYTCQCTTGRTAITAVAAPCIVRQKIWP